MAAGAAWVPTFCAAVTATGLQPITIIAGQLIFIIIITIIIIIIVTYISAAVAVEEERVHLRASAQQPTHVESLLILQHPNALRHNAH
jgi:hypothetical protein